MKGIILIVIVLSMTGCAYYEFDDFWSINLDLDIASEYDVFLWVEKNIKYQTNNETSTRDYWQTPQETLTIMSGDCEDKVLLMMAIYYKSTGIKTYKLSVNTNGDAIYNHAVWKVKNKIIENQNYNGCPFIQHSMDIIPFEIGFYR